MRSFTRPPAFIGAGLTALLLMVASCSSSTSTEQSGDSTGGEDPLPAGSVDAADPTSSPSTGSTPSTARSESVDGSGADPSTPAENTTSTGETYPVADASWSDCGGRFQCATVDMPLDHDDPTGSTIEIGLIRIEAPEPAHGSIFVNLGGPGGSAIGAIRAGFDLDEETMSRYHLVGFDPRGIGASAPLRCGVDLTAGPRPDFSPDTDEEAEELDRQAKSLAQDCARLDGELLPHLGTDSVIRDLDLLRQAVGDSELHYFGLSYGTLIGLRYAERYPAVVGHMVLDGVVDPAFSLADLLRQQAGEFDRAFQVIDAGCGTALRCPDGGITASYDRVLQSLEDLGPQGDVGPAELQFATLIAMYSEELWPRYSIALSEAETGNFAAIENLHDLYAGAISFSAYIAVLCIDSQVPIGAEAWDDLATELDELSPRFGSALANEVRS
ncbi:MAG: alpha/beta fold hydrolase, partial [Acidimicrobiales bacterium]